MNFLILTKSLILILILIQTTLAIIPTNLLPTNIRELIKTLSIPRNLTQTNLRLKFILVINRQSNIISLFISHFSLVNSTLNTILTKSIKCLCRLRELSIRAKNLTFHYNLNTKIYRVIIHLLSKI